MAPVIEKGGLKILSRLLHSFDDDEPAPFPAPVIIFAILLGLNLLAIAYQIKVYVSFMNSSTWAAMTHPQFSGILYTPALEPLLYSPFVVNCASLAGMLALLILLARKSWSFLKWVRVYLVGGVIYQLLQVVALICLRASLPGKHAAHPSICSSI